MNKLALGLTLFTLATSVDHRRPEPEDCSTCRGEPATMARLKVESHGDFRFARTDSKMVEEIFDDTDVYWIEGEHVKLGFADVMFTMWPHNGGPPSGNTDDAPRPNDRPMRSLANGALAYEPYARAHAYLERAENLYTRIQDVLRVEDSDFPKVNEYGKKLPFKDPDHPYMGEGPFLGQRAKYELLIMPGKVQYDAYAKSSDGLQNNGVNLQMIEDTDAISVSLHLMDGSMWDDDGVTGYMLHHMTHAFLTGYKHNAYPTPVWIQEGLAHALERENSPLYTSFCGTDLASEAGSKTNDWTGEMSEILRKRKKPYLESLLNKASVHAFTYEDHIMAWSMVRFFLEKHPDEFAALNADLRGIGQGRRRIGMPQVNVAHLNAFDKHLNMNYAKFDKDWSKWAKKQKARR